MFPSVDLDSSAGVGGYFVVCYSSHIDAAWHIYLPVWLLKQQEFVNTLDILVLTESLEEIC